MADQFRAARAPVVARQIVEMHGGRIWAGGNVAFYAGGPQSAAIVEQRLVRVFWNHPDGRQATIAFISSSELVGGTTLMCEQ